MRKISLKNFPLFTVISLLILMLISYGQTVFMYFLIDDNAIIYKLQHIEQNIGLFGRGIFGEGPYRHVVDQFIPFYPIFGINPMPYFTVGVVLYFLTSVFVFLFVRVLTKNFVLAFSASVVFVAGYVGSEAMFGIFNSWQTTRGLVMVIITFWLFYKYINSKNITFYILSVILFFFSLDTVYIRAHGLVFSIFFFDLLFWPTIFKLPSILGLLLRQAPFVLIHYYIYLSSTAFAKQMGVLHFFNDIFSDKKYVLATIPIQDIGNLFIPDFFTHILDRLVNKSIILPAEFSLGSFFAGILIIFLTIYLVIKNFRKEEFLIRVLIFSFLFALSNFVAFWLRETNHTLWTTHRYFLYSFVGVSLFWPVSFYLISKQIKIRNLFMFLTIFLITIYLLLGVNYQRNFNQKRSFPAKNFFSGFKHELPDIPKGAVIYFDLENDNKVKGEFGNFFGGIFSEGSNLAIYYPHIDYMKDFIFTYKFDDVIQMISEGSTNINKVFTFYYGENGLVNTTEQARKLLENQKIAAIDSSNISSNTDYNTNGNNFSTGTDINNISGQYVGSNPTITIHPTQDIPSLVPAELKFSMRVNPKIVRLPYKTNTGLNNISPDTLNKVFTYLEAQNIYFKTASASAASFWKDQEPKLALDARLETSWRGHRGFWDYIARGITKDIEFLSVELKRTLTVSQVKWVSAQRPLVPTHYRILTSLDGKVWNLAKEVTDGKVLPEGTTVFDSFSPTEAQFVKMEVLKTYGNDGPEIKEFEVIEDKFANIDRRIIEQVEKEPFGNIETRSEYETALSFVKKNAVMKLYFMSSADTDQDPTRYIEVPVYVDGKTHGYSFNLPATGINWTTFSLTGFNFPARISISSPRIIYKPIVK